MEHYYTKKTKTKSNEKIIEVHIKDQKLKFITDNAVFSKKGLDFGTRNLLENIPKLTGKVLDIGCGYGPIGIYLKKVFDIEVTMSDINLRALKLAK